MFPTLPAPSPRCWAGCASTFSRGPDTLPAQPLTGRLGALKQMVRDLQAQRFYRYVFLTSGEQHQVMQRGWCVTHRPGAAASCVWREGAGCEAVAESLPYPRPRWPSVGGDVWLTTVRMIAGSQETKNRCLICLCLRNRCLIQRCLPWRCRAKPAPASGCPLGAWAWFCGELRLTVTVALPVPSPETENKFRMG